MMTNLRDVGIARLTLSQGIYRSIDEPAAYRKGKDTPLVGKRPLPVSSSYSELATYSQPPVLPPSLRLFLSEASERV